MYSFSYLEPVCCSMSSFNCCFLTCIQISQEAGQVVWYSHLVKNFPQFIVIHTVKGFGIVNKAEILISGISDQIRSVAQSCLTLCDPIDGSPLGSSVPGILQARILEWVAIAFSNAWKWKVKVKSLSRVQLLATPWTGAYQAPLSMGFFQARVLGVPLPSPIWKSSLWDFSRQEYWGCHCLRRYERVHYAKCWAGWSTS